MLQGRVLRSFLYRARYLRARFTFNSRMARARALEKRNNARAVVGGQYNNERGKKRDSFRFDDFSSCHDLQEKVVGPRVHRKMMS